MIIARPYRHEDLALCNFIDGLGTQRDELPSDAQAFTFYESTTKEILTIVGVMNNLLCDGCDCNPTMQVGFMWAIFCEPFKDKLKRNVCAAKALMTDIGEALDIDLLVIGRSLNNPLGKRFLPLIGFEPIPYPLYTWEDNTYDSYILRVKKDLTLCKVCYMR